MSKPTFNRHRLDGLVDAVLAITMTLLVLELRLPEELHGDLLGALDELQPKIISWVVSFLILALCWLGHTRAFHRVAQVDSRLFWLVALWLLFTSVIPFSSAMIGEHNELFTSHVIYAANIILIEVSVILRNMHLKRHPELLAEPDEPWGGVDWVAVGSITTAALASVVMAAYIPEWASIAYALNAPISRIGHRLFGARGVD
jgi:uncharacterized membrane protein